MCLAHAKIRDFDSVEKVYDWLTIQSYSHKPPVICELLRRLKVDFQDTE